MLYHPWYREATHQIFVGWLEDEWMDERWMDGWMMDKWMMDVLVMDGWMDGR